MLLIHLLPRPLASKANFSRLGYILISYLLDGVHHEVRSATAPEDADDARIKLVTFEAGECKVC